MMFKFYRKKGVTEIRPYVPGEDLEFVSVPVGYEPKEGDMIARSHLHHGDVWLMTKQFFEQHYEEAMVLTKV